MYVCVWVYVSVCLYACLITFSSLKRSSRGAYYRLVVLNDKTKTVSDLREKIYVALKTVKNMKFRDA